MISTIKTASLNYINIDKFLETLIDKKLNIKIEYESQYVNNQPTIVISLNNVEVYYEKCSSLGNISLNLSNFDVQNVLEIGMTGKQNGDTLVEGNQIVKDTYIKFLNLHINNYSLLDDYDFFYNKFLHLTQDRLLEKSQIGLWSNSALVLNFSMPFEIWYNSVSQRNCSVSDSLKHQETENLNKLVKQLEQSVLKLN
jgi:hypothetical protein